MSKSFDNASRTDAYCIDPLEICIIGGKSLPKEEQGPKDTAWDPTHPLHAHDLLKPLDPLDVDSVEELGVLVPIEVVKHNNLPTVSLGRGRVRKARLANQRRKAKGLPPITVRFVIVRISNGMELMRRQIDENLRRKTIGVLDRIELAKQYMARGASEEEAAKSMGVKRQQFDQWMSIEDNATPAVKAALREDRLSPSAAIALATIKEPEKQDEALATLLSTPDAKPTARAARRVVNEANGGGETRAVLPKAKEQKKLLAVVDKHAKGNEWMQGAKAALRWVTGEGTHKDLAKLLEAAAESEAQAE